MKKRLLYATVAGDNYAWENEPRHEIYRYKNGKLDFKIWHRNPLSKEEFEKAVETDKKTILE